MTAMNVRTQDIMQKTYYLKEKNKIPILRDTC